MQTREYTKDINTTHDEKTNMPVINYALTISDYVMGKVIQHGTRATVYHGYYQDNRVAIKKAVTEKYIDTLRQEKIIYELIAEKRNVDSDDQYAASCIIGYYGYSLNYSDNILEQWMSLVLEYANGGTLAGWIFDESRIFDWTSTGYRVMNDFMSGIYYLHKCDYVHRDIKPDNILLHYDHENVLHGKISDFGESLLKSDVTSRNTSGTIIYMAPEIFTGGKQTDKTDIYSAGITIWEMAARKPVFENTSMANIIKDLENGEREEIPISCPPKVRHIISWFWQQDPASRPTAKESLEELKTPLNEVSPRLSRF